MAYHVWGKLRCETPNFGLPEFYWSSWLKTCVISLTTPGVISEVSLQTWLWPSHSWSSDGFINSKRRLLSLPYLSHTCIASGVMSFAVSILYIFSFEPSSGTCQTYTWICCCSTDCNLRWSSIAQLPNTIDEARRDDRWDMYRVTGAHEDKHLLRMSLFSQGLCMHNKYMYVQMLP